MILEVLSDPFPSRGLLINRHNYLGSQLVSLREQIPAVEKQARKTPPKTMKEEWEKVRAAREMLPKLQNQVKEHETEREKIKQTLIEIGEPAFKPARTIEENLAILEENRKAKEITGHRCDCPHCKTRLQ